jgi:hypothetical protein
MSPDQPRRIAKLDGSLRFPFNVEEGVVMHVGHRVVFLLFVCFVASLAVTCGDVGRDNREATAGADADDTLGDDSAVAITDDSVDDTGTGEITDDDGEPPAAPCDIRATWHATINPTMSDEQIVYLLVETREYNPLYGAFEYTGCSIPEEAFTTGMTCPERTYAGESDGYDFKFTNVAAVDAEDWYVGVVSEDCAQYKGQWVQTWPCCSAVLNDFNAYMVL